MDVWGFIGWLLEAIPPLPFFLGGLGLLFTYTALRWTFKDVEAAWMLGGPEGGQIIVSAILLLAALYVILSKQYDATDKHWAYGTIGTILGFWLRPYRAPAKKAEKT